MHLEESTFIRYIIFRDRVQLTYGEDYVIDSDNLDHIKLTVYNCDEKATYRIFVVLNNNYIHSIAAELDEFNKET